MHPPSGNHTRITTHPPTQPPTHPTIQPPNHPHNVLQRGNKVLQGSTTWLQRGTTWLQFNKNVTECVYYGFLRFWYVVVRYDTLWYAVIRGGSSEA